MKEEKKWKILLRYLAESVAADAETLREEGGAYEYGYFDAKMNIAKIIREINTNDFETYGDFAAHIMKNAGRLDKECEAEKETLLGYDFEEDGGL